MNHQIEQFVEIAPALGIATAMCFFGYLAWLACDSSNKSLRKKRERFKDNKLRKLVREQNLQAQLRKPTFQTRLQNFVRFGRRSIEADSTMQFWQADEVDFKYVPPKPIELIRTTLIRLKKLFILGAK